MLAWASIEKAVADFTEAIEIEPDNHLAYRNRALAYKKLGELRKAQRTTSSSSSCGAKAPTSPRSPLQN